MKLWNDYEGKIIAEAYPLKKLLRPEGRSAFFVTTAKDGAADVIRITESLNDEHEMLERWRQVSEVHQANLVEIKTYGTTTFDGVPLTYALMEGTDASLAEILKERPLTAAETMQVATSVVAALKALHAISLIHEHIEPASVVASGEIIKLRSDCVRECVVDQEFTPQTLCEELRQRDVHDFAVLLLQCLTLDKHLTSAIQLPAPFDGVVRHGIDGSWGLAEIERALAPVTEKPLVAEKPQTPEKPLVPAAVLNPVRQVASPRQPPRHENLVASKPQVREFSEAVPEASLAGSVRRTEPSVPTMRRGLHLRRLVTSTASLHAGPRRWMAGGLGALIVALLAWFFAARTPAAPPVPAAPTDARAVGPAVAGSSDTAAAGKTAAGKTAVPAKATVPTAPTQAGWHVIAYTYVHEGQAAAKAAVIARKHSGLNPKVFAPSGHAPYFVALGGGMSEGEAAAVLRTARRDGLPRDTFIRLYRPR